MALDVLQYATFTGPAFPEPFVRFELESELNRLRLLPGTRGDEGRALQEAWEVYRRRLRELVARGGAVRVRNHILEPLVARLGYEQLEVSSSMETREGREDGGHLMLGPDGERLRVWATALDEDLDAPARRGRAYRFSHARIAQRVLLAAGERMGLLTNGVELRILISDPARPDSQIAIPVDPHWKRSRDVPDTYRLLVALASPAGVRSVSDLVDKARLQQTRVTSELRAQARQAIERFVQSVLDHPDNRARLATLTDKEKLARDLWREGLITIYRLLFILKLESSDDPARSFSFASTSLWRNSFSPSVALARYVHPVLEQGVETGRLLEDGLRALFRMFAQGLQCSELRIAPLGGSLFGTDATPLLSELCWGEHAVAHLLDRLLWTPRRRGATSRERVHYGPLDVEDLGRVYEALLELEPGITTEPMCRLRRQKLEVVVPVAQGERYRPADATQDVVEATGEAEDEGVPEDDGEEENTSARGKKTKVEWIEEIPSDRFYLRVGLGRKASGSYYTPHAFVRFLVQETLGPQVAARSPENDPQPGEILKLKVLDPAMGSGHFLVEACRFLGEKLYEACRLCDERALAAERQAESARSATDRETARAEMDPYRQRVIDLPDPDDELVRYLPSRAPEGEETGLSQKKAEALCRRLVAVHCLYGVDKNPLAVELAKLALWLESHAEGLPLTFLDHRLVLGDSLTGPFFEHLLTYPGSQVSMDDLLTQGLRESFTNALLEALKQVHDLEASVGASLAETEAKTTAKRRLDRALVPFKIAATAWAGGVMLGGEQCDDPAYADLVKSISQTGDIPDDLKDTQQLLRMIAMGAGVEAVPTKRLRLLEFIASGSCIPAFPYELEFPEVFFPYGEVETRKGFDAVIGNPPWDAIKFNSREFLAAFDLRVLDAPTKREREKVEKLLLSDPIVSSLFSQYQNNFEAVKRANDQFYDYQKVIIEGDLAGRQLDAFRVFMERNAQVLGPTGRTGVVVPSAFHSNAGATGVRRLYLEKMSLQCCYSFENRKKLFDIDSRFKFAVVVAQRNENGTREFPVAFYLHEPDWLFQEKEPLVYSLDFVQRTSGEYLTFLELTDRTAWDIVQVIYSYSIRLGDYCREKGIKFQKQPATLDMTKDSGYFRPIGSFLPRNSDPREPTIRKTLLDQGLFYLSEGKTFHQFDEQWGDRPSYLVLIEELGNNPLWVTAGRHYRLAFRAVASSTNERTAIFCLLSPGTISGNSAAVERTPQATPRGEVLFLAAAGNTFVFDWCLRTMISANLNLFFVNNAPLLDGHHLRQFLSHMALRLTCNHEGYAPLWQEQVGEIWREPRPPFNWPVIEGNDERWKVRATIDAVVADAYGLSREQYAHVLSTFSHSSYSKAPELILAYFDELKTISLENFIQKYDPYWDVPLNENLPEPVIDLPIVEVAPTDSDRITAQQDQLSLLAAESGVSWTPSPIPRTPSSKPTASRRAAAATADDDTYDLLKLLLEKQGVITSADAQDLTGLDAAGVRQLLKRLVVDGHAMQEGQRRGTKYHYAGRGHADEDTIC